MEADCRKSAFVYKEALGKEIHMKPTKLEQETIILFNEAEKEASIYTYNGKLKRRLEELSREFPEQVWLKNDDGAGAQTYIIPKNLVSVRRPVSEERRAAQRERALTSLFRSQDTDETPGQRD